jgi:hypothetical protein
MSSLGHALPKVADQRSRGAHRHDSPRHNPPFWRLVLDRLQLHPSDYADEGVADLDLDAFDEDARHYGRLREANKARVIGQFPSSTSSAPPVRDILFGFLFIAAAAVALIVPTMLAALGDTAMHALSVTLRGMGWL